MSRPLYQLRDAWLALMDELEECGGELGDDLACRLDELEATLEAKVAGCAAMDRNLKAAEDSLKTEIDRLRARHQAVANSRDRLKSYLKASLEAMGIDRIEAGIFQVRVQRNTTPTVEFLGDDADDVPPGYQRIRVEPDRAKVAEDWKAGRAIPPIFRVSVGTHLRIR